MFKNIRLPLAACAFLLAFAAPATAQGDRAILRDACAADYQRLCANVQVGGGRIKKCMAENADKLSDKCKAALQSSGK